LTSLFDKWSPVTYDFGLIQGSAHKVADAYAEWFAGSGKDLTRATVEGSLAQKFDVLLPLTHAKNKRLFMATNCGWVGFFQNGIRGSDPFPTMMSLSQRLGVVAMRVCITQPDARYPSVIWEVYAPENQGGTKYGYRRSIAASNDGGRWVFEESGERYPFEQAERYSAKRKRDRFTPGMLEDYLSHFGLPKPGDDLFGAAIDQPALLFDQEDTFGLPQFTLDEVKDGLPWKRDN